MHPSQEFVYTRTYARWDEEKKRRETWPETVSRVVSFLKEERGEQVPPKVFRKIEEGMLSFAVLPSMRLVHTAGEAARRDNTCIFNCTFSRLNSIESFAECCYILMCGAGYGFSVYAEDICNLPTVQPPTGDGQGTIRIDDSREGWADSVKQLLGALYQGRDIDFDYGGLRPRGAPLKTMGGRSSGPGPLIRLHEFIRDTFSQARGRQLSSLEVHDIANHIADIVVVGGVRRSSQISLSDLEDDDLRWAKEGENVPVQRFMSNNSARYTHRPAAVDFLREWAALAGSGTGERGIFNLSAAIAHSPERRDATKIAGCNPCGEILLRSREMCNLSEVVIRDDDDLDTLLEKVETATWIGCIQSTFTNFPYLSPEWKKNCEEERLLGVSLTGQMDNPKILTAEALAALKKRALRVAKRATDKLGINFPAAITCVKPSGCRPADALVTCREGIFTLEELIVDFNSLDSVWSEVSGRTTYGAGAISKTFINGDAEIFRVSLSFGMSVESTANHRWYVQDVGWKETKHLTRGDQLVLDTNIYTATKESSLSTLNPLAFRMRNDSHTIRQPEAMNPDIAWFLGYLWGDGAMSPGKYRIRFTDQRKANLEKAQHILKTQFDLDAKIHTRKDVVACSLDVGSKMFWHWLIRNGVWKYFENDIDIIPRIIRTASQESLLAFFSGLFDADGCYSLSSNNRGTGTLTTASRRFANHIQQVAWTVGLCFGVSHNKNGDNFQSQKSIYPMSILGNSSSHALKLFKKHSNKITGSLRAEDPKKRYRAGVVKGVEPIGTHPTFDVETEKRWFYAGAIKSHNTVSQLVDSASGVHARYAPYYLRRYRINADDPLCLMLRDQNVTLSPENGQTKEDWDKARKLFKTGQSYVQTCNIFRPNERWTESKVTTWVVAFPMAAPKGSTTRNSVSALDQLEHYKKLQENWCEHNASCTVYVKPDEWFSVGEWVYRNWDIVNGISFLPYDAGVYKQPPYEEITKVEYEKALKAFPKINYTELSQFELEDTTTSSKELACSGDKCEI